MDFISIKCALCKSPLSVSIEKDEGQTPTLLVDSCACACACACTDLRQAPKPLLITDVDSTKPYRMESGALRPGFVYLFIGPYTFTCRVHTETHLAEAVEFVTRLTDLARATPRRAS